MLREHEFFATYQPLFSPHDPADHVWEHEETLGYIPERVWTLVEGDDSDNIYALAGYHTLEVYGYLVTTIPWTSPEASAFFYTGRPATPRSLRRKGTRRPDVDERGANI